MTDLFAPTPTDNLLPYDGKVNDLGIVIDDTETLYDTLLAELPWQSDIVTLFGQTHVTTRQIVWMGETEADYQYSGHTRQTATKVATNMVKTKAAQVIPAVGAVVAGGVNANYTANVCEAAYQCYRERFLDRLA